MIARDADNVVGSAMSYRQEEGAVQTIPKGSRNRPSYSFPYLSDDRCRSPRAGDNRLPLNVNPASRPWSYQRVLIGPMFRLIQDLALCKRLAYSLIELEVLVAP